MKNRDLLIFLHERLEYQHGENPLYDYMHLLREIINKTPETETSVIRSNNLNIKGMKCSLWEGED